MKKILLSLTAIVFVFAFANSVMAAEYTLFAGQTMDVGTVEVTNDGDFVFATYETTGGWEMTETHLSVECSESDVPRTEKKGDLMGPIPGHFEYSDSHNPAVTTHPEVVPMPIDCDSPGDEVVVSAHASVRKANEVETIPFVSEEGVDVYGEVYGYLPLEDLGWGESGDSVLITPHPAWPTIQGASWISNTDLPEGDAGDDSWRLFRDEISIPDGAIITSASVEVTSDNAEEAYLNGVPVGEDGEVEGPFVDNHEWKTIKEYDLIGAITTGSNTLDFIVRNYAGNGANPTGLIYSGSVEYFTYQTESAWGAAVAGENRFVDKGNWATFMDYQLTGRMLVDTVLVDSSETAGADSIVLELDQNYEFEVSGTWENANNVADAEYTSTDSWANYVDGRAGEPGRNDLQVNHTFVDWGPYSSGHTYTRSYVGDDNEVNFRVFDGVVPVPTPGWYGDNDGILTVEIYAVY